MNVANCSGPFNVETIRELSQETYLLFFECFRWVSVRDTIHKFLAHVYQFKERNNSYGICNLFKEGL